MSELQQKINSENKAAEKARRDAIFASKVENLKGKIAKKIDERLEKIDKKQEKRAEKAQLQKLKEKAAEEYEAFLELYDPSKEGTIEVFEKEAAKITIVHTKNGPLIEVVKDPVEIPPAEEPKTIIGKEMSQTSTSKLARGCYDSSVTYQGYFPEKNERGVVEIKYGKINKKSCNGIGDWGPHNDFNDSGASKFSGSVRNNGLLGGKFEIIQESRDGGRYGSKFEDIEVFKILESSFNQAKKEASKTQANQAESEGAGLAME